MWSFFVVFRYYKELEIKKCNRFAKVIDKVETSVIICNCVANIISFKCNVSKK
jgi:hypothetical protein